MAYEVTFRPEAEGDLHEIYTYIADNAGLRIAGTYVARIEAACLGLATFPWRGAPRRILHRAFAFWFSSAVQRLPVASRAIACGSLAYSMPDAITAKTISANRRS